MLVSHIKNADFIRERVKIGNSSAQHNKDVLLGKSQFLLLGNLPLGNWPPWEIVP